MTADIDRKIAKAGRDLRSATIRINYYSESIHAKAICMDGKTSEKAIAALKGDLHLALAEDVDFHAAIANLFDLLSIREGRLKNKEATKPVKKAAKKTTKTTAKGNK